VEAIMLNKYIAVGVIWSTALLSFSPSVNASYYGPRNTNYYDRNTGYYERSGYYDPRGGDYYDGYSSGHRYKRTAYNENRQMKRRSTASKSVYKDTSLDKSPLPSKVSGGNIIKVDLGKLAWGAYDDQGNLVKWGPASGGKSYCPDIRRGCRTVTGTYTVYSKKGPECKSSRFPVGKGGAPMPYCMHFKGGYAMHGGQVPGYNASHGCIRMLVGDAKWLNQNFVRVGSTRVSIKY